MGEKTTKQHIIDTARSQFMERGFSATTIRGIAEAAGVSPALVMKLTGSKAELFRLTTPDISVDGESAGVDELPGYRLARAIVERRDTLGFEYWVAAATAVLESPDRDSAREEMRALAIPRISAAIGDDSEEKLRTRFVITLLLGLAASLRTVQLIPQDVLASEQLVGSYGSLIQSVIDDPNL